MSEAFTKAITSIPVLGSAIQGRVSPRRAFLAGGVAATASAAVMASIESAAGAPSISPDAELIQVCHRFAEAELAIWFRYVVAPVDLADAQDVPPDWDTLHWIENTPAASPEGWCAKALALSAWHRDVFDDPEEDRDGHTPLLASLVRDMVAPTRNAIMARLVQQHGPLPGGYTVNGMWLGRAAA
jgi:hypothetical protein